MDRSVERPDARGRGHRVRGGARRGGRTSTRCAALVTRARRVTGQRGADRRRGPRARRGVVEAAPMLVNHVAGCARRRGRGGDRGDAARYERRDRALHATRAPTTTTTRARDRREARRCRSRSSSPPPRCAAPRVGGAPRGSSRLRRVEGQGASSARDAPRRDRVVLGPAGRSGKDALVACARFGRRSTPRSRRRRSARMPRRARHVAQARSSTSSRITASASSERCARSLLARANPVGERHARAVVGRDRAARAAWWWRGEADAELLRRRADLVAIAAHDAHDAKLAPRLSRARGAAIGDRTARFRARRARDRARRRRARAPASSSRRRRRAAGRLDDAESAGAVVAPREPDDAHALRLAGMVARSRGHTARAVASSSALAAYRASGEKHSPVSRSVSSAQREQSATRLAEGIAILVATKSDTRRGPPPVPSRRPHAPERRSARGRASPRGGARDPPARGQLAARGRGAPPPRVRSTRSPSSTRRAPPSKRHDAPRRGRRARARGARR